MPRGAYVLPRGLLHRPKCLAVVRTCKGNFVYFEKCPVGSKGHLGILSHCHEGRYSLRLKCISLKGTLSFQYLFYFYGQPRELLHCEITIEKNILCYLILFFCSPNTLYPKSAIQSKHYAYYIVSCV